MPTATIPPVRRATRLLVVAYGCLIAAWVLGNPPLGAPDEGAQHLRALALARADLGEQPQYPEPPRTFDEDWYRRLTRTVDVPERLAPRGQIPCFAFDARTTADCTFDDTVFALDAADRLALEPSSPFALVARLDVVQGPGGPELRRTSYQGAYPPAGLLAPGVGGSLGWSPDSGIRLARLAGGAVALALLWAGLRWLPAGDGGDDRRLLGALVALTPMAVFVTATVSASSAEVAAAFAWTCGALRVARGRPPTGAGAVVLGVAGALLATARQVGPAWIAATVALVAWTGQGAAVVAHVRRHRAAAAAAAVTAAGVLGGIAWIVLVFPRAPARTLPTSLGDRLGQAAHDLGRLAREGVGVFGWLDIAPPAAVHAGWGAATAALVVLGWRAARPRNRAILAAVVGLWGLAAVAATWAAYDIQAGAQGRWLLPIAMAVPLVAAELWAGAPRAPHRSRRSTAAWAAAAGLLATAHLACLWANERRYAVGADGPIWFPDGARWAPPGGWLPVAGLALVGAGCLVAAGTAAARAATVAPSPRVTTTHPAAPAAS